MKDCEICECKMEQWQHLICHRCAEEWWDQAERETKKQFVRRKQMEKLEQVLNEI